MIGIGERIRVVRGDESLPSFADKLGIHKNTLARYEKEESLPDVGVIIKICEIATDVDVTPNWLIEGDGPPPKPSYFYAHQKLRARLADMVDSEAKAREVINKVGLNLSASQLIGYISNKEMISDFDLVNLCDKFAFYDSNLVVSKRIFEERKETNFGGSVPQTETSRLGKLNRSLLKEAVEIIEDLSQKNEAVLSTSKKSDLITLIYEDMLHLSNEHDYDDFVDRAERMIKLVL